MIPIGVLGAATPRAGGAVVPTTWDPSAKHADITLSDSDLEATGSISPTWRSVYATKGHSAGKYAFEIIFAKQAAGAGVNMPPAAGIADKTNLTNVINDRPGKANTHESLRYWLGGSAEYNLTGIGSGSVNGLPSTSVVGDVATVALDLSALEVTIYLNGGFVHSFALPAGKTWYPVGSVRSSNMVRLRASGLAYLPAGFSEWD